MKCFLTAWSYHPWWCACSLLNEALWITMEKCSSDFIISKFLMWYFAAFALGTNTLALADWLLIVTSGLRFSDQHPCRWNQEDEKLLLKKKTFHFLPNTKETLHKFFPVLKITSCVPSVKSNTPSKRGIIMKFWESINQTPPSWAHLSKICYSWFRNAGFIEH